MAKNPDDFGTIKFDSNKMKEAMAEMEKKAAASKPASGSVAKPLSARPLTPAATPAAKPPPPPPAGKPVPPPPAKSLKATEKPATPVCALFPLSDEGKKLLQDTLTVKAFLDLLVKNKLFLDAVRLVAFALPKREAVWWGYQSARSVAGATPPPPDKKALEVAEKWVKEPTEDNRRPALDAAEAAGFGTPAGCAALAAFWTGGSLAPPNVPVVPPGETLPSHGAASAVLLAAVVTEPDKAPAKYAKFLAEGVRLAEGAADWPGKTS